jgi:hypothetical protein
MQASVPSSWVTSASAVQIILIYGALLETFGRVVSCQMQWKTFAIQQNELNYGAISLLSRGDLMQEGIADGIMK